MPGEAQITIVGNITADPETRQVGSNTVVNFTVAQTPRVRQEDGSYADGEATFYRVSAWRDLATNIASSLSKGDRVVVNGTIAARSYEKDGDKRLSWEVTAEEVGPSLRFATAQVTRASRGGQQQRGRQPEQQRPRYQQEPQVAQSWSGFGSFDDSPF